MTDKHRLLLLVASGILLFSGLVAVVDERSVPARASESPLLEVSPPETTTTTVAETTTAVSETTVPPVEDQQSTTRPAAMSGGAIVPPKNAYAPEPIQEIGTIEIPRIGLNHKIMHGITLRNIDFGPSHWPGTPLPGEAGNVVFAGHRVTHTHPFRRINELEAGDDIFFTVAGVRSHYVVSGHEVVSPSRLDIVNPTPTPTATLFACHPPGSARQRYVVRAALVTADAQPAPAESPMPTPE
ncbi:MAG TPA: class E sortase [Acidimicrobiales bacterium]|nr:class E sortase [Acidimicrobiales bacterium]